MLLSLSSVAAHVYVCYRKNSVCQPCLNHLIFSCILYHQRRTQCVFFEHILLPWDSPSSYLNKTSFFSRASTQAVFFNQISTAHSVLFHFLMTVQPVSLNELTRVLLVTLRQKQTDLFSLMQLGLQFLLQCISKLSRCLLVHLNRYYKYKLFELEESTSGFEEEMHLTFRI